LNGIKEIVRHKKYYEDNIDKIQEQRKEKITCECGSYISKSNVSVHIKSKKHLKYFNLD
jgi:hypothetical protein